MKHSAVLLVVIFIRAVAVALTDEYQVRPTVVGNAHLVNMMDKCMNSASTGSLACRSAGQSLLKLCYFKI